jgi:outer membrane receptor protein involved in Fe transport
MSRIRSFAAAFSAVLLAFSSPAFMAAQVPAAPRDTLGADSLDAARVLIDTTRADTTRAYPPRADPTRADPARRAAAQLAPVTVVAAPAERAAPVSARHVGATEIRTTPAATPYDLLRQTAGLEVHEQGQGPGFASDASLRGFSSDHSTDLALWIDGVPVNEPVNGHSEGYNDWSVLFPGGVEDVDVIRGPTSALFGNFALAGIVNVRTLERMDGSRVTATAGSYGRADAMALAGFDHGADGGGVLGLRFAREDGFRPNAGYDLLQGHGRLVRDLRPGVTLDGGVELYGTRWNSAGFLGEQQFVAHEWDVVSNPTDGGFKRRAQERVSLRVLGGPLLWRTTLYATQSRWQLFLTIPPAGGRFEGTGSQTEEEDHRSGYGLTSALSATLGRTNLTVGGEGRWDRSRYEDWFTTMRARDSVAELVGARQLTGALFVASHTELLPRLRVDVGARYDALATRSSPDGDVTRSATHGVFSPKVGAIVQLAPALSAYGNVSRGFRSTDGVISDPALAPITAWAYETGVKTALHGATANIALFRMDVSNEQTFDPLTGDASNGGASRRQGVEVDWRVPFGASLLGPRFDRALVVTGDWTVLDARYRHLAAVGEDAAEGTPPEVLDGLRVYNTAKYVGSASLAIAPRGAPWRFRVGGNWVGPYSPFDRPGEVLGGYGLLHASAGVQVRDVEIDAGIRNALDRAYPELVAGEVVSPGQPRALFVTARVGW